jgi:hypothetical protein
MSLRFAYQCHMFQFALVIWLAFLLIQGLILSYQCWHIVRLSHRDI